MPLPLDGRQRVREAETDPKLPSVTWPLHKYPDIFLDLKKCPRYLENFEIFRKIYSFFGSFPGFVYFPDRILNSIILV